MASFPYQIRLRSEVQKRKSGVIGTLWYVSVTHPEWTHGVDSVGASTLLGPSDDPTWVQSKRDNLRLTLLQHCVENGLAVDGLNDALVEALQDVKA
jgi:hypothetical protein